MLAKHLARAWWLLVVALPGCITPPSPAVRLQTANQLAEQAGWQPVHLQAGNFVLAGFVSKMTKSADTLTVYIEGDGLAWISSTDISPDPTPMHPIALQMALQHLGGNTVYLARPCQYVDAADARNCSNIWWTDRRFAPEVVEASSAAIDQLKKRFNARQLVLIGYSGGGAIAALVAARRHDVSLLVTVAGNLDHAHWTRMHFASPLSGSLNPVDYWQSLINVPQIHYVGSKDNVVPHEVTDSYLAAFPIDHRPSVRVIDGFDHACCWAEKWTKIYRQQADASATIDPVRQ